MILSDDYDEYGDDEYTPCEQFGHVDEYVFDEDDEGFCTYGCRACGAEWWDD